jgi:hypothetical protein
MDNSKSDSPRLKFPKKKLFKNAIIALGIFVLLYLVVMSMFPRWARNPNAPAMSALRNLQTALEVYHADHNRYPQNNELLSFPISDGVTAFFVVTSFDKPNRYCAVAFSKKGDRLFVGSSDSPVIWYVPYPKEGLVTAEPL